MGRSFEFDAADHFTAGAVGPPGQRVFHLQARQDSEIVTLQCEKEQVGVLAAYLAQLLARLPAGAAGPPPGDVALIEPVDVLWLVAALGAGFDGERNRVLVEVRERVEEDADEEPAVGRVAITRAQTAAFIERVEALMQAGRPLCAVCHQPKDPGGHVCPRSNGHVVRPPA